MPTPAAAVLLTALATAGSGVSAGAPGEAMSGPIPVELVRDESGWRLLRGGEPYFVRGAGGRASYLHRLAEAGGNSFRTWGVADVAETRRMLDRAHELGMSVLVGLSLPKWRHFDYGDDAAVAGLLDAQLRNVEALKDHPAVLAWGVGNEVMLAEADGPEGAERCARFFTLLNGFAERVKAADPHHPVATVIAGANGNEIAALNEHAPGIDLVGVNAYGGSTSLSDELRGHGLDRPFMLTEFGSEGFWVAEQTEWGAPIEPLSGDKAETFRRSYLDTVMSNPGWCLGSYAFLWGHKNERTATWFSMILETGEKTEPVDVMTELWTGCAPENRCPRLRRIVSPADRARVAPGSRHEVRISAGDPDHDPLTYRVEVERLASELGFGGSYEPRPERMDVEITPVDADGRCTFVAPTEPGGYRLFVYVFDGRNGAATGNFPFWVEASEGAAETAARER